MGRCDQRADRGKGSTAGDWKKEPTGTTCPGCSAASLVRLTKGDYTMEACEARCGFRRTPEPAARSVRD